MPHEPRHCVFSFWDSYDAPRSSPAPAAFRIGAVSSQLVDSQLVDANGYDWSARGELAYYKKPAGCSDEDWSQMAWAGFASATYFGPTVLPDGPWTLDSTAKAAAWQERRRRGVPYIHRINCKEAPSRRPLAKRFCWVVVLEPGAHIHHRTFESALGTLARLYAERRV
ncbi:hypothetical protein CH275_05010 [Rhodococcus sp. 06-235-1A]|nr:hypothetical protein CH275_05010 [Rhodococcus sp. 06-235-1A]